MKKLSITFAGLALVLGMAVPGFSADTIKLGVAGPHSGDLAPYGT